MKSNKACERCGKSKPVGDFINKIYPERGLGVLCQSCRRKSQKEPAWKQKRRIEVQGNRFERRKKARIKKYNKLHYDRMKQESTRWLEHMKNMGRMWDCGIRENARLWREHLKLTADISETAKRELKAG